MTILNDARTGLATLISAAIPTVQVSPFPLGENQSLEESVFFDSWTSEFEWRSLGNDAKNRSERIEIEIVVHAYHEAPSQTTSATTAIARCEELLEEVETAIVASGANSFTVGGRFTFALLSRWSVRPVPREAGWACEARATFTGTHYPA